MPKVYHQKTKNNKLKCITRFTTQIEQEVVSVTWFVNRSLISNIRWDKEELRKSEDTLEIAKSWVCMPFWSRLKLGPKRSISETKHQKDSDSSPVTNNIGDRRSLIPYATKKKRENKTYWYLVLHSKTIQHISVSLPTQSIAY